MVMPCRTATLTNGTLKAYENVGTKTLLIAGGVGFLFTAFTGKAVLLLGRRYLRYAPVVGANFNVFFFAIAISIATVGMFGVGPAL